MYLLLVTVFMVITVVNYIVCANFPVANPLPNRYPWSLWVSLVTAAVISVPALWLMIKGMIDAGSETICPEKGNLM